MALQSFTALLNAHPSVTRKSDRLAKGSPQQPFDGILRWHLEGSSATNLCDPRKLHEQPSGLTGLWNSPHHKKIEELAGVRQVVSRQTLKMGSVPEAHDPGNILYGFHLVPQAIESVYVGTGLSKLNGVDADPAHQHSPPGHRSQKFQRRSVHAVPLGCNDLRGWCLLVKRKSSG